MPHLHHNGCYDAEDTHELALKAAEHPTIRRCYVRTKDISLGEFSLEDCWCKSCPNDLLGTRSAEQALEGKRFWQEGNTGGYMSAAVFNQSLGSDGPEVRGR